MARIGYSEEALEDFERITDYLLEHASLERAQQVAAYIRKAVTLLGDHPYMGTRVKGELRKHVISYGATGHVAFYHFDLGRDEVKVGGLIHQREAGWEDV